MSARAPVEAAVNYPEGGIAPVVDDFDASGCIHPGVEKSCADGWCRIPAGCFVMGSPPSEWGHPAKEEDEAAVTLTRAFELRQHETTRVEWAAMGFTDPGGSGGSHTRDCLDPACPIGHVTWYEALAYANRLSEANALPPCYVLNNCTGNVGSGMTCESVTLSAASVYECSGYRLATHAEWQYAARAGTRTAYYSGDITRYAQIDCYPDPNLESIAWYCFNSAVDSFQTSHPVEQKEPNPWGLYDMLGNMAEWVNDKYTGRSVESSAFDPGSDWTPTADSRPSCGGDYFSPAPWCRTASDLGDSPTYRGRGFRLARTLDAAHP